MVALSKFPEFPDTAGLIPAIPAELGDAVIPDAIRLVAGLAVELLSRIGGRLA
jgi:hypothetical protein